MLNRLRALRAVAALCVVSAVGLHTTGALAQATQVPNAKQCFQATSGLTGMIGTTGTLVGGAGGALGIYTNVPMTGGTGTGASANITVALSGAVTGAVVYNPGVGYAVGDTLSAASGNIGGVSGFSVVVASTSINSSLAGGTVGMYVPGTLTPSNTWTSSSQTTLNTNPITLDSNGCATIWGVGTYRQIVYDSLGNTVWDKTTSAGGSPAIFWAGSAAGTPNAITVTDANFTSTAGQMIQFRAAYTNTGATTLAVSGGTAIPIVIDSQKGPAALKGGEIAVGSGSNTNIITVVYDSTNAEFHLVGGSSVVTTGTLYSSGYLNTASTDNSAGLLSFWAACVSSAYPDCQILPGHYLFTQNVLLDAHLNRGNGWRINCAGQNATLLDWSGTSGTHLTIASSLPEGWFYGTISNCGFYANNPTGPAFQIGRTDLTDASNGLLLLTDWAVNSSGYAGSSAIQINEAADPTIIDVTANNYCSSSSGSGWCNISSGGDTLQLVAVGFGSFIGGSYSSSTNGIHITGSGFTFANVFTALDLEVVYNGILYDAAHGGANTWIGGQYVYNTGGGNLAVDNSANIYSGQLIENPNPAGAQPFVSGNSTNFTVRSQRFYGVTTPSIPASGTTFRNVTGRKVLVNTNGGTITQICWGISGSVCQTFSTSNIPLTTMLNPGDYITLTYTGSPAWVWNALQ